MSRYLLSDHEHCIPHAVIRFILYAIVICLFFILIKILVLAHLSKHIHSFRFEEIVSSKPYASQQHEAQTASSHDD